MDVLEFDVKHPIRGSIHPGKLKLNQNGLLFKSNKTGKVDQLGYHDVDVLHWMQLAHCYELKFYTKAGNLLKFDGFKEADYSAVKDYLGKHCEIELETKEMSVKGWNWGQTSVNGKVLSFEVEGRPSFEIPLENVMKSTPGKNEIALEFHQSDDSPISLMEMRLYIPAHENVDTVMKLHEGVVANADIMQATGDAIATIPDMPSLTPRGRYEIKLYSTFLHLYGKTYDYKIPYNTVLRLFLLPHKDGRSMFFVISLDPPIKQGQTRYHFVILQFNKDEDIELELNVTDEELETKYQGKLQREMSGTLFEVVSRTMKSLIGRKITVPGGFRGATPGSAAISCSHRASSGFLYPLDKGFLYVHKPPVHIRFDEIVNIDFARAAGSSRFFDFEVETRNAGSFTFSSIEKEEYGGLYDFVNSRGLRVRNRTSKDDVVGRDDDISDEDEDNDYYMKRMKREGKEREDVDDDSDSEDEDFKPKSESDVAEEYDSNAGETSSDGDEPSEKRRKRGSSDEERKPKKVMKVVKEKKFTKKKTREVPEKKSKRKDPNAPKKPVSAYLMWLNDNRSAFKAEEPNASVVDIAKMGGERWKKVSGEEKREYDEKVKVAKIAYAETLRKYQENNPNPVLLGTPPRKKGKGAGERGGKGKGGGGGKVTASPRKGNPISKEFVSSSSDDDSSDTERKPSKKLVKPKKEVIVKEEVDSDVEGEADGSSEEESEESEEEERPLRRATTRSTYRKEEESDAGELPSEEEILSGEGDVSASGEGSSTSEESE